MTAAADSRTSPRTARRTAKRIGERYSTRTVTRSRRTVDVHPHPAGIETRRGQHRRARQRGVVADGDGAGRLAGAVGHHDLVARHEAHLHQEQRHQHEQRQQQCQLDGSLPVGTRPPGTSGAGACHVISLVMDRKTAFSSLLIMLVSLAQASTSMAMSATPSSTSAYSAVA